MADESDIVLEIEDPKNNTEKQFNFILQNRAYYRTKIRARFRFVRSKVDGFNNDEKQNHLTEVKTLRDKLIALDKEIDASVWKLNIDREKLNRELDIVQEIESECTRIINLLELKPTISNSMYAGKPISLPHIPLPEYGNEDGESLEVFFTNFQTIIDNSNLSDLEKFIYLKQQLRNDPLALVSSLRGDQQSFKEAKALLEKAFASKISQKFNIIDRLTKLSLSSGDNIYEYVSELRNIIHTFNTLNVDSDVILQYFAWKSMPDELQSQFLLITGDSKPDIWSIEEHIFTAVERCKNFGSYKSGQKSFTGLAANVKVNSMYEKDKTKKNAFRMCILCSDNADSVAHSISKCTKYAHPKIKLQKMKELNLCTRCMGREHSASNCNFKFKNCFHCNTTNHFSFMCFKNPEYKNIQTENKSVKVNTKNTSGNNTTVALGYQTFNKTLANNVILPTFTSNLNNKVNIRCLKDSGAQSCFIDVKTADKYNLKVIKNNVNLTVKGFNSTSEYLTKIVECEMRFGDSLYKIAAICVPDISINLKLPGLHDIVKDFRNKGYRLADQKLLNGKDHIDHIEFIFGSTDPQCLFENTVKFGNTVYTDTVLGVMLSGKIVNLKNNLNMLPSINTKYYKKHVPKFYCSSTMNEGKNDSLIDESCYNYEVSANCCIIAEDCVLSESTLNEATQRMIDSCPSDLLNEKCHKYIEISDGSATEDDTVNSSLIEHALNKSHRDTNGRNFMPILWNEKTAKFLGNNYYLAKQVLMSNLKKLKQNSSHLAMVDSVFKEQLENGIISELDPHIDLTDKIYSFLAHMPVFKPSNNTTKCRVVYLANLAQKGSEFTVSHNKAILPGPPLNQKISTALINLRLDKYLCVYDICKAFLQIGLDPEDQKKLCMLWFKDVQAGDYSIVAYTAKRLPFGLPCSPTILMLTLFKMLVLDGDNDEVSLKNLKLSLYQNLYMDNGGITAMNSEQLRWAFDVTCDIFESNCFPLQKFITNDPKLQEIIYSKYKEIPIYSTKLLGLTWNLKDDTLTLPKLSLNIEAKTKRQILSSVAENYDIFNICGPILIRARLFLHKLQKLNNLDWDAILSDAQIKEWQLIAAQVNKSKVVNIPRYVGSKQDSYQLIACTDSSKDICGLVVYLFNNNTKTIKFMYAKNKLVGKLWENKSIPCLELAAVTMGAEALIESYTELAGPSCVTPMNITDLKLYTDSHICIDWINNYCCKFNKINKLSVFVKNRLFKIVKLCDTNPITFRFCSGVANPADLMTRSTSSKQLNKSNFYSGPSVDLIINYALDLPDVVVPPKETSAGSRVLTATLTKEDLDHTPLIDAKNVRSLDKLVGIYHKVLTFINKGKIKIKSKKCDRSIDIHSDDALRNIAFQRCILDNQKLHFGKVFEYFENSKKLNNLIPPIVSQLNIFKDNVGILRVKAKFKNWRNNLEFPILLAKDCKVAELVIKGAHKQLSHAGIYTVLSEVRRSYWIPKIYSLTKSLINKCILCRRFNNRNVKINQSSYRDFRTDPSCIPYRTIFIDHCGPFTVTLGSKLKVYILVITCLWSRSVNLIVCRNLSIKSFLEALQIHIYSYGVPELILSDLGSQLVGSGKIVTNFLDDEEVRKYLFKHQIKNFKFQHYDKGRNELGSVVEIMVKLTKRLLYGAVRNLLLDYFDFVFFVHQTKHLVNRRPIAFKESLGNSSLDDSIPQAITPEMLVHGFELPSLNIIPGLQGRNNLDSDWTPNGNKTEEFPKDYERLIKARKKLISIYNEEFFTTLSKQATTKKNLFAPVKHNALEVGDVVLIKDDFTKLSNLPMAIVTEARSNDLNEINSVTLKKGTTGEVVNRHVSTLIPLFKLNEYAPNSRHEAKVHKDSSKPQKTKIFTSRPKRKAAENCKIKMSSMI